MPQFIICTVQDLQESIQDCLRLSHSNHGSQKQTHQAFKQKKEKNIGIEKSKCQAHRREIFFNFIREENQDCAGEREEREDRRLNKSGLLSFQV